jgi:DNA-binding NarL/FixJ family response regulator
LYPSAKHFARYYFSIFKPLNNMHSKQPYVIVLDDHPLVGRGIAHYLQATRPELKVFVIAGWPEVQQHIQMFGCPAVLVADVWLADSNSLAALAQWRSPCRNTPWLAISGDDDPLLQERVRQAGAQGFVHKQASPDVFGLAFAAVLAGGQWYAPAAQTSIHRSHEWSVSPAELGLTARQGDILALVLRGLSNKRIALALNITESTVKEHVTGILEKLGVHSRVEAITHLRGKRIQVSSVMSMSYQTAAIRKND